MKKILPLTMSFMLVAALGCNQMTNSAPDDQAAVAPLAAPTAQPSPPPEPAAAPSNAPAAVGAAEPSATGGAALATIDEQAITDAEVTERVKNRLRKLESQIFDIKSDGLQELIEERLVENAAKKKGVSSAELLKAEVDSQVKEPSEEEIQNYYELLKSNFKGQELKQVKPTIVRQIKQTRRGEVYDGFLQKLKASSKIKINIERPRMEVAFEDDDPYRGPKDAPIVIHEFSEFQCPFCKRVQESMDRIEKEYAGKVVRIFRDFPLSFHKNAQGAAVAANCANEQNKFWELSGIFWENQRDLDGEKLEGYAKQAGLNMDKYKTCFDSGKYDEEIEKDVQAGQAAGVSGTPAFFINGIFLSGAQPYEKFRDIIEEDLMRKGK